MGILLTILLWLLILLGGLLLVLLLVPIEVRAEGEIDGLDATGSIDIRWGWVLLGLRIARGQGAALYLLGLRVYRMSLEGEKEKKKKDKKEKKSGKKRGARWAWRNRHLFLRILRAFHLRGWLWGTIGTGDPADTAMIVQSIFRPIEGRFSRFHVCVEPDYLDDVLELGGAIRTIIWPLEFVAVLLVTLVRGRSRRDLLAKS